MNEWDAAATELVAAGDTGFWRFAKATVKQRRGAVRGLRRKLSPLPPWLDFEDTEQDYLAALVVQSRTFDPGVSDKPGAFLRWGLKKVGKRIQKARGVEQHRRTGPARFERSFTSLGWDEPPDRPSPSREFDAEWAATRAQYYEILRRICETPAQRAAICALEAGGGSLDAAAARLYSSPSARRRFRLFSERQAARMVRGAVDDLIAAYGKEGAE